MQILRRIAALFHRTNGDQGLLAADPPKASPAELFHSDGWGPTHRFGKFLPARYAGPLFPAQATSARGLTPSCIKAVNRGREEWSLGHYKAARDAYHSAMQDAPDN